MAKQDKAIVPPERIKNAIYLIRSENITLSDSEFANLKSQILISSWGRRRSAPYAFTEQGVATLSGVLQSNRANESLGCTSYAISAPPSGPRVEPEDA